MSQEYWVRTKVAMFEGDIFTAAGHDGTFVVLEYADADLYRVRHTDNVTRKQINVEEIWKR